MPPTKMSPARYALLFFLFTVVAAPTLAQDAISDAFVQSYRYEKAQNYQDAIKVLMALDKKDYLANLRLGWLYYLSGNYANSRLHYQAAIVAAPKAIEPRLGYMLPLLAQGKYLEVEAVARQVLTIDSANYYASLRLAVALRMQGKFPQAQMVCVGMLELYPTDISFLVELGLCQGAQKNRDAASQVFRQVLTLDPENVTAKQQLNGQANAGAKRNGTTLFRSTAIRRYFSN
jgi:tetratricopeptide (TPR) repeat protein